MKTQIQKTNRTELHSNLRKYKRTEWPYQNKPRHLLKGQKFNVAIK